MGFLSRLGSFGYKVWDTIKGAVSPIVEALGLGQRTGVPISAADAYSELTHIYRKDDLAPYVASVAGDEYIPDDLYSVSPVPWNRPYAYEVEVYGRDLLTGRYTHTGRVLTFSEPVPVEEVMDRFSEYFSPDGVSAQLDVYQASVTAAFIREGESRRSH